MIPLRPTLLAFSLAFALSATAAHAEDPAAPAAAPEAKPAVAPEAQPPAADAPANKPLTEEGRKLLAPQPYDYPLGKSDAPVTIVEYASLSCTHCAAFHNESFPKLKKAYIDTGKVRYLLRDFPLNVTALKGSQIARCAGPERYHDFIRVLFAQQSGWAFSKDFADSLKTIAGVGGMSIDTFNQCITNTEIEDTLIGMRKSGSETLGVESTPTFFVNGNKVLGGKSYKDFEALIDDALAKAGKN